MRIDRTKTAKSSFLSAENDMGLIIGEILKNERLKKLLHYTSKDALESPNITPEQTIALIGKNIKNVPKVYVDRTAENYIYISFDNFIPNPTNPEFRDNTIEFEILCHYEQWVLKDFKLRPYRIAAEIDSMFNDKHLTGIGKLEFIGCVQTVSNDEFAGLSLVYRAVHGDEDSSVQFKGSQEEQAEREAIYLAEYQDKAALK
jgi:hypothetical protein